MEQRASHSSYTLEEGENLSHGLIRALSEAKGRDITEDECVLYNSIDPDALNKMFRKDGDDDAVKVEFATHDAIVIIWGNGEITIQVQDLERDPNTTRENIESDSEAEPGEDSGDNPETVPED